jgi:hypothetical protein
MKKLLFMPAELLPTGERAVSSSLVTKRRSGAKSFARHPAGVIARHAIMRDELPRLAESSSLFGVLTRSIRLNAPSSIAGPRDYSWISNFCKSARGGICLSKNE